MEKQNHQNLNSKNKELNIAVVCDSIDYTLGGSSISAKRFVTALKNRGHKILLVTNSVQHPRSKFFKDIKLVEIENHYIFKSDKYIFGKVHHKFLENIFSQNKIDLVYSVYPTTFSGNAAAKAAKKLNLPLVGHFHVQAENVSFLFSKIYLDRLFYRFFNSFYNKCDLIFCPSIFAQKLLKSSGVNVKTQVLSNGVDLTVFTPLGKNNRSILAKYGVEKNDYVFLYLGRLEGEKDILTLLKACKLFLQKNSSKILIAGNGTQKQELIKYIVENKISKNVILTGFIKNSEIVDLYNSADCFVSPSLIELEGMTVLEAMACKLPIILSNSKRSASKYFVNENGFLFRAKSYTDLADKMQKMFNMGIKDRLKLSKKSLEISKEYSFDNSVLAMEKTFINEISKKRN